MATKLYDAIVSTDSTQGDYTLPSAAFNAGKKSIFIRSGTYTETQDIIIPDGGSIRAETPGGVILNFLGTAFGIKCGSSPAPIASAGTITLTQASTLVTGTGTTFTSLVVGNFILVENSYFRIASITDDTNLVINRPFPYITLTNTSYQITNKAVETMGVISGTNNSNIVTGTGTTFTNLEIGDYISLGTVYARITAITSDTSLTIFTIYKGITLYNLPYRALSMFSGITIQNITIYGSTDIGLYVYGCRQFNFAFVTISDCKSNLIMENSGNANIGSITSFNSSGVGYTISNCLSISTFTMDVVNNTSDGVFVTGDNFSILFVDVESSGNGGCGFHIDGKTRDTNINKCISKYNVNSGFCVSNGAYGMSIDACNSTNNGSYGAELNGDDIILSGGLIQNNGDHGIVVNGNECIIVKNVCKYNNEAIRVSGSSNNISDNICRNSTTYGVHITSTAVNNIVTYNNLTQAGYGTYNDEGTNTLLEGNLA